MKYRKKPVVIEAERYVKPHIENCLDFCGDAIQYDAEKNEYYIKTLEGDMYVSDGDYIIKGIRGEFYPCKPISFELTYETPISEGRDRVFRNQSEAKQYYDGFLDGKHAAARSILEAISNLRKDANNGYMFDMVDEIEKRALVLNGGEHYTRVPTIKEGRA